MTLALYRKYRPRSFSEMIGQEHVTEPLSQALRTGRLNHAYLFSGPRGCGKTSSARILARSLNCEKGPTPDPCGECDSCRALAPDGPGSIDVIEIDAASHGGVDDARDLRERAFFAPVSSRFKVYVIDEAHMVSSAGFNALLKLVEEPPEYVKFVFATTEPEKVLGTIKSRTHHYPFRLIPPSVVRPYLEKLAASEGAKVEAQVFPLVVRAGGGSMRDTLSVLDQLIAGAGPEGVTYARAVALLGVTDVALIDEVCDALAAGDGAAVYTTIDRVAEAGHDPRRFAGDLLERLRDLIVLQQVPDAIAKGLLDGADDELERMAEQAQRFGSATLSRMADIVHTGLVDMRGTTAPRLVLELIAARMLLPGADDSADALLARMERLERRMSLSGDDQAVVAPPARIAAPPARTSAPAPSAGAVASAGGSDVEAVPSAAAAVEVEPSLAPEVVGPEAEPASEPVEAVAAEVAQVVEPAEPDTPAQPDSAPPGAIDAAAIRRIWGEALTMVRQRSRKEAAYALDANVRDVIGNTLVLLFKFPLHAEAIATSPGNLQDALYEILGIRFQIRCDVAGQPSGPTTRSAPPAPAQPTQARSAAAPPARPAAPARQTSTAPTAAAATSDDDDDWPETAQLGGDGADGGVPAVTVGAASGAVGHAGGAGQATVGGQGPGGQAAGGGYDVGGGEGHGAVGSQGSQATMSSGQSTALAGDVTGAASASPNRVPAAARAAARAAAARSNGNGARAGSRSNGNAARPGTSGAGADEVWAGSADEEPPYDPEFDAPVVPGGSAQHVGFDPGDEPIDDDDPAAADRPTSEQQAIDLLRDALGAEKIG